MIILLGALTLGSQPARPTEAHPTLKCSIAIVAAVTGRLCPSLAGTVTVKGDLHSETVLESHRLDGEGLFLLLGAAAHLGLDAETHLHKKQNNIQMQVDPLLL